MAKIIDDSQESNIPAQAVKVLKVAQPKAKLAGRPLVLVIDRVLVRIAGAKR